MSDIFNEEWRPLPGYEKLYSISNLGNVRSEERRIYYGDNRTLRIEPQKIKKLTIRNKGKYLFTTITKDGISGQFGVHRLVAWTFIGEQKSGIEVRHKNGNGLDNRLDNLCYGTRADNMQDAIKHGTFSMGEKHPSCRFSTEEILYMIKSDLTAKEIAQQFNTSDVVVQRIWRGDRRGIETIHARTLKGKRKKITKFTKLTRDQLTILKDFSITQRDAGKILGFPQRTIWRWRNKNI